MTGEQLQAVRPMVRWEQIELARRASVSVKTVKRLEAVSGPLEARSIWSIKNALELAGIEFLDEDEFGDWGDGVRLYADRTAKLSHKIADSVAINIDIALMLGVREDGCFLSGRFWK